MTSNEDWNSRIAKYREIKAPGGDLIMATSKEPAHYICWECANQRQQIHPLPVEGKCTGRAKCRERGAEYQVQPMPEDHPDDLEPEHT